MTARFACLVLATSLLSGCGLSEIEEKERDSYWNNGVFYFRNAHYESARDQFEKALAIDEDHYQALLGLGFALVMMPEGNMLIDAGDVFLACLDRNEDDPMAHLGYATVCFMMGVIHETDAGTKFDQAEEHRKISQDPQISPEQKAHYGDLAADHDAKARQSLDIAAQWFPKAHDALARARELDDKNPLLLQMLAFNQAKMGLDHFPQAIDYFGQFVKMREEDIATSRHNLDLMRKNESPTIIEEARVHEEIRLIEVEVRKARSMTAWMYVMLSREPGADHDLYLAAALEQVDRAGQLDPLHPSVHLNKAKLYGEEYKLALGSKDNESAIKYLQLAQNELFQFQAKNQLDRPVLNVWAREVITQTEDWVKNLKEPPSEEQPPPGAGG